MKIIKGDLVELAMSGRFDVLVHGMDCFYGMNSGASAQIARAFPEAVRVDRETRRGDRAKLGTFTSCQVKRNGFQFFVVNAYVHYDYDGEDCRLNYAALRSCMRGICRNFGFLDIGIDMIGRGVPKSRWELASTIIADELGRADYTVVIPPALVSQKRKSGISIVQKNLSRQLCLA